MSSHTPIFYRHLFSFSLDTSCFLNDKNYPGGDTFDCSLAQHKRESAEECQIYCQQTPDCVRFVYAKETSSDPQYKKSCCLKDTIDIPAIDQNDNVAGLRTCAGAVCFLINQSIHFWIPCSS